MAQLISIGYGSRFHCAISPVPNQRVHRKFRSPWDGAARIESHHLVRTHPHADGVVRERRGTHQLNARLRVRTWRHARHFCHPSLIPTSGVVVDVQLERHTPRRVVNGSRDAHPHKRIASPCTYQIRTRVVPVEREKHVVVVGVGVGLKVEGQEVHLHRIARFTGAERDGVVLIGVRILKVCASAVVVREVNRFRRIAIHRDGAAIRDWDHDSFLGLDALKTSPQQDRCHHPQMLQ